MVKEHDFKKKLQMFNVYMNDFVNLFRKSLTRKFLPTKLAKINLWNLLFTAGMDSFQLALLHTNAGSIHWYILFWMQFLKVFQDISKSLTPWLSFSTSRNLFQCRTEDWQAKIFITALFIKESLKQLKCAILGEWTIRQP